MCPGVLGHMQAARALQQHALLTASKQRPGVPGFGEPAKYRVVIGQRGDYRVEVLHQKYASSQFAKASGWLDLHGPDDGYPTLEGATAFAHRHAHADDTVADLGTCGK